MTRYTGIFTRDKEDGGWIAQCAEVPSAITQGETIAEARASLKHAIKFMLTVEAKMSLKKAGRRAHVEEVRV